MKAKCLVCEHDLTEHNQLKNVYYCNNIRCTRLGVLTVYILEEKKVEVPATPPAPTGEEGTEAKDESPTS